MGSGIFRPGELVELGELAPVDEGPGSESIADSSRAGVSDIVVEEKEVVSIGVLISELAKRGNVTTGVYLDALTRTCNQVARRGQFVTDPPNCSEDYVVPVFLPVFLRIHLVTQRFHRRHHLERVGAGGMVLHRCLHR